MDHRCLYGHRVPDEYAFAIRTRQCPVCGAQTVTVVGYQLARRLAQRLEIDPLLAFNAIRLIEDDHEIAPRAAEENGEDVSEIEVPEDEIVAGEAIEAEEAPSEEVAAGTEAPEPARLDVRRAPKASDDGFDPIEADFFKSA